MRRATRTWPKTLVSLRKILHAILSRSASGRLPVSLISLLYCERSELNNAMDVLHRKASLFACEFARELHPVSRGTHARRTPRFVSTIVLREIYAVTRDGYAEGVFCTSSGIAQ